MGVRLATTVVENLRLLLGIKPGSLLHVDKLVCLVVCGHVSLTSRHQVPYGLNKLLRNNAANIYSMEDWNVIFTFTFSFIDFARIIPQNSVFYFKFGDKYNN
jgi:hypothetical protein